MILRRSRANRRRKVIRSRMAPIATAKMAPSRLSTRRKATRSSSCKAVRRNSGATRLLAKKLPLSSARETLFGNAGLFLRDRARVLFRRGEETQLQDSSPDGGAGRHFRGPKRRTRSRTSHGAAARIGLENRALDARSFRDGDRCPDGRNFLRKKCRCPATRGEHAEIIDRLDRGGARLP